MLAGTFIETYPFRRGGFFQSQRGAAAGGNFFHIGGSIRQANHAEPAHESVAFARNDDVLIVGRRKKRPAVAPAEIADIAKIFGVHRQAAAGPAAARARRLPAPLKAEAPGAEAAWR